MTYASIPRSSRPASTPAGTPHPGRSVDPNLRIVVPAALEVKLRSHSLLTHIGHLYTWLRTQGAARATQSRRRMRVTETVSLGDKRFVAILQVDGERILIGGSPGSVSLLKELKADETFGDVLHTRWHDRESA